MYNTYTPRPYHPTKNDMDAIRYLDNQLSNRRDNSSVQIERNFGRGKQMLETSAITLYSNIDFENF
jgi:hypothetical protein